MRKRERENPCGVCGHYHKYEEGEICGICGHRAPDSSDKSSLQVSAFPSEILPEFLYLGSYDNASRSELLKTQGISRILNTVPACQNLYKNSFTYYCLQDEKNLQFDDANQFLEQCERDKARVLVHCMSGRNRSPAFVIAFLMKSRGWKLAQSYQWVKDRRPPVQLNEAVYQQLQEYEANIFGSVEGNNNPGQPLFNLGFPKVSEPIASVPAFGSAIPNAVPAFGSAIPNAPSIFERSLPMNVSPHEFTFGSNPAQVNISGTTAEANQPATSAGDIQMD